MHSMLILILSVVFPRIFLLSLLVALPFFLLCLFHDRPQRRRDIFGQWFGGAVNNGLQQFQFRRGNERPSSREQFIQQDRKSTRLNSSHLVISYAVFCLK